MFTNITPYVILLVTRRCFYFGGIRMAKETMKVDNGVEEIKLVNRDKMKKENKKNKNKTQKKQNKKKNSKKGFIQSVKSELKLVTWPNKKTIIKYSGATIVMLILLAAFFVGVTALFDLLYSLVQGWIG